MIYSWKALNGYAYPPFNQIGGFCPDTKGTDYQSYSDSTVLDPPWFLDLNGSPDASAA